MCNPPCFTYIVCSAPLKCEAPNVCPIKCKTLCVLFFQFQVFIPFQITVGYKDVLTKINPNNCLLKHAVLG